MERDLVSLNIFKYIMKNCDFWMGINDLRDY